MCYLLCIPEELNLLHVLPEDDVALLVLDLVRVGLVVGRHEGVEVFQTLQLGQLLPALLHTRVRKLRQLTPLS